MGKIGNFLKKAAGFVTGVAGTVLKSVPIVGSTLTAVSERLQASSTPIKDSSLPIAAKAAIATTGVSTVKIGGKSLMDLAKTAIAISTPQKSSSIAILAGLAPAASTPIKQSAADLTGTSAGQSALMSVSKPVVATKTAGEILGDITGTKKDDGNVMTWVIGGLVAVILFIVLAPSLLRRRR